MVEWRWSGEGGWRWWSGGEGGEKEGGCDENCQCFLSPSSSPSCKQFSVLPQAALVETDSRSDDLEKRNHLLEGEVADLRQNLKEQSQADEHIMALMNTKTKEWQVSCDSPASSFPSSFLCPSSCSLSVLRSSFLPLDLAWHKYFLMIIPLAVSLSAPSLLFFFFRS